jgi:hypothetical protein
MSLPIIVDSNGSLAKLAAALTSLLQQGATQMAAIDDLTKAVNDLTTAVNTQLPPLVTAVTAAQKKLGEQADVKTVVIRAQGDA